MLWRIQPAIVFHSPTKTVSKMRRSP